MKQFAVFCVCFFCVLFAGCGPDSEENKIQATTKSSGQLSLRLKSAPGKDDSPKVNLHSSIYGRKDPFDPAIDNKFDHAGPQEASGLKGIMWSREHPIAVINGKLAGIGSKTALGTVTDIQKDKVILQDETGPYELKLGR